MSTSIIDPLPAAARSGNGEPTARKKESPDGPETGKPPAEPMRVSIAAPVGAPSCGANGAQTAAASCGPCEKIGWCSLQKTMPAPRSVNISKIDLDVTEACNLACPYCFKWQKKAVHMDEATAMSAIDWLFEASGDSYSLGVNLFGGEPLLRFDLIQKIVPYATLRAFQLRKSVYFGATTNCTLATERIVDYWRRFKMSFHCSIDGIPEVQNVNRPFLGGGPSSSAIEKNVARIIAYQPTVMSRATISPASAHVLYESSQYLVKLGFRSFTFRVAADAGWTPADYEALRGQYEQLAKFYIERLVANQPVHIAEFDERIRLLHANSAPHGHCGAGHNMVLVDPRGDMWPCHRYGPHLCEGGFRMGTLGGEFDERMRNVLLTTDRRKDFKIDCSKCRAHPTCATWCIAESVTCNGDIYWPADDACNWAKIVHDIVMEIDIYLKLHHADVLNRLLQKGKFLGQVFNS